MGTGKRVVLYARASTEDQTYSTSGQIAELTKYAQAEGLEVVGAVEDKGEKRHTLDRPGIRRLRELCESGGIQEVWAWDHDRYGEFPQPEVLAVELEEHGVALRSLGDGGGGESSYELNVIKSLFLKARAVEPGKAGTAR